MTFEGPFQSELFHDPTILCTTHSHFCRNTHTELAGDTERGKIKHISFSRPYNTQTGSSLLIMHRL